MQEKYIIKNNVIEQSTSVVMEKNRAGGLDFVVLKADGTDISISGWILPPQDLRQYARSERYRPQAVCS